MPEGSLWQLRQNLLEHYIHTQSKQFVLLILVQKFSFISQGFRAGALTLGVLGAMPPPKLGPWPSVDHMAAGNGSLILIRDVGGKTVAQHAGG